jgi:hypothetical protein
MENKKKQEDGMAHYAKLLPSLNSLIGGCSIVPGTPRFARRGRGAVDIVILSYYTKIHIFFLPQPPCPLDGMIVWKEGRMWFSLYRGSDFLTP